MSLVKTLARVALGVVAYKGITNAVNSSPRREDAGLGGLLDRMSRPREGSVLDKVISGLGGPERVAMDRTAAAPGSGGLDAILDRFGGRDGMLGTLVGGAAGSVAAARNDAPGGSFVEKLRQAEARIGEPDLQPAPEEEAVAALMLRAMIQSAKADGTIDPDERAKIMANMETASPAETEFLQREMDAPVDIEALAAATPAGMEREVYAAAALAVTVDSIAEQAHMQQLADALRLSPRDIDEIRGLAQPSGVV